MCIEWKCGFSADFGDLLASLQAFLDFLDDSGTTPADADEKRGEDRPDGFGERRVIFLGAKMKIKPFQKTHENLSFFNNYALLGLLGSMSKFL